MLIEFKEMLTVSGATKITFGEIIILLQEIEMEFLVFTIALMVVIIMFKVLLILLKEMLTQYLVLKMM